MDSTNAKIPSTEKVTHMSAFKAKRQGTSYDPSDVINALFEKGIGSAQLNFGNSTMKIDLVNSEEEIRKVVQAMEMRQRAYKYYSSVWYVGAIILCFFVTLGFSGLLGPISTATGIVFSIVAIAGAVLDWKGWQKRNDASTY